MAIINRWYQILNSLVRQPHLPIGQIQKELGISHKTLLNTIDQLNDVLNNDALIKIDNNYLYLQVLDYQRFEDILTGSLRKKSDFNSSSKRASFIIKQLIQSSVPILIDDLAEKVGVSRTTINKDLKKVKDLAKDYQIKISGRPNIGITAEGEELELRLLYCHNVYSYFDITNLTIESREFLKLIYQKYNLPLHIQELLSKVIDISILRLKEHQTLDQPIPYFCNGLKYSDIVEEIVSHIELTYHISLSQYEQDFLSFPLNIQYIDSLDYQKSSNDIVLNIFDQMICQIKESFDLRINIDKLFIDIHTHLKFLINRLMFHSQASDLFYGEIKKKYPLAYQLASKASTILENLFNYPIESSEISYLALYFEMGLREIDNSLSYEQRKIAVVCTTGRGTATMINRQLRRVLGNEIVIDQYSEETFNPNKAERYSAIFTTIPLKLQHLSTPVIQITNLFDDHWLRNQWEEANEWKQNKFQWIESKLMYLTIQNHYFDYLSEMSNFLYQEEDVDIAFYQRILKREEKQSTIFGNNIAFPHTTHPNSKVIFLVGILEEPYESELGKVDFIFMLAIPDKVNSQIESELLSLYDDIFRIANNSDLKKELKSIKTIEAFHSLIQDKGVLE
ncbi:BglG family transcription antiterminator [Streptococcus hyovaginalis]|uniref:BglG family transcription antiterminator n=1 Tax=Streptococcus hyovaginalis TaxID=149015 RepID=UPI00042071FA|nr:PRD domain-containing protein [Streptococcus hyovaginalis]